MKNRIYAILYALMFSMPSLAVAKIGGDTARNFSTTLQRQIAIVEDIYADIEDHSQYMRVCYFWFCPTMTVQ